MIKVQVFGASCWSLYQDLLRKVGVSRVKLIEKSEANSRVKGKDLEVNGWDDERGEQA